MADKEMEHLPEIYLAVILAQDREAWDSGTSGSLLHKEGQARRPGTPTGKPGARQRGREGL